MRLAILRELSRGPAPLALLSAVAGGPVDVLLAVMQCEGLVARDGAMWIATRRAADAVASLETCDAIDSPLADVLCLALAGAVAVAWGTRAFAFVLASAAAIALCIFAARLYARRARRRAAVVVGGHPEGQAREDVAQRNRIRKAEG